ncbi:hypothetical protein B2M27_15475 (plasmid) [Kluyvera intermedia]|uniref:Uncharacterized protein n=1 Tax=Kluyvera intermedia TaxID=61648 RepID=A0ABX3UD16_KLUIN|nr:hypothetical protein B2M27_15475 [Kluyvera intermedia]
MAVGGQIREITLWTGFSLNDDEVTRLYFVSSVFTYGVGWHLRHPLSDFLIRCDKPPFCGNNIGM